MGTHQLGRIYEASGKFYVQYRVVVNGKRVQRSHFLCAKDDRHRSTTDRSVKLLRDYKQIWRQHLKSHFGNLTLQEYAPHTGTVFLDSLTGTQGKATLRHIKACATSLFKRAVNKQH